MSRAYYNITSIIKITRKFVFITLFLSANALANAGYGDLDEFNDLELQPLDKKINSNSSSNNSKKLILFDDNLYLLDDDFDFGDDEFELKKLELDPDDMETAREYENFLNAFFDNAIPIGTKAVESSKTTNNNTSKRTKLKSPKETSKTTIKPSKFSPNRPPRGAMGFSVSTIIGLTMPVTMAGFSMGSNFGMRIDTPISFNLAGMEANIGTDIYLSSFSSIDDNNFKITNFVANVSLFPIEKIEVRTGLGFTPVSIGDYSDTGIAIPVDLNYYLPMSFSGFKFALNLHAQRTFGYPPISGSVDGDSTDFMYLGLLINTPLTF